MQAIGAPSKLRFTIQSCSGEDPDYPVRELLYHSLQTRGWQSPRFCKYPQEIVLKLERPSKVQQIQILTHETKIPTKIEVFVGFASAADAAAAAAATSTDQAAVVAAAPANGDLKRLGYLSFDSNERSEYKARELKSVHINVNAQLVRLLIHRCHVNKHNIYNQVGIIALNLIGEELAPVPAGPMPYLAVEAASGAALPYYNRAAAEAVDLNLDMAVDSITAARIKELVVAKEAAVAAEDYDEAKRLKGSIERLKVVGGKIAQLENRKRLAVEREDYDLAKALKADIEKLRIAGESAALAPPGPATGAAGSKSSKDPEEIFNRVLGKSRSSGAGATDAAAGDALHGAAAAGFQQQLYNGSSEAAAPVAESIEADLMMHQHQQHGSGAEGSFKRNSSYGGGGPAGAVGVASSSGGGYGAPVHTYQAYEDRPAVAKAAYVGSVGGAGDLAPLDENYLIKADPSQVSAAAMFGSSGRNSGAHGAGWGSSAATAAAAGPSAGMGQAAPGSAAEPTTAAAPTGWPADLPTPDPLSVASAKEAEPVVDVAGEFVASAFFSRNWQLRDAAAGWLADLVANGRLAGGASSGEKREVARGLVRLAVKGLKDKVPQVYSSCLGLFQALLAALGSGGGGSRDVFQAVESSLPVLLERLSDNNTRLRDSAREALVSLAQQADSSTALRGLTSTLCKVPKNQTAWRPILSLLQLQQELVPLLGISGASAAGGFDLGELMDFVGRAFGNANADVRAAALRVAVTVAGVAPGGAAAVRRLLPKDLNPKIKEQVDAALGPDSNGSAPAQQATPAKAGRGGGPAGGGGAAAAGGRSAGKAATTSGHPNRQAAAAAATGPAPSRQQQQQQQRQQPPPQPPPPVAVNALEAEDPGPFIAELAAREQQYGTRHPAVAESCSNLAILYNQKGDYAAALPLYERALAIYEANYGPDHQEVAHTLTDLAVLHLEQGHDSIGRPLLERAVAIQEAALGPNHPDVLAIKDVLNSE